MKPLTTRVGAAVIVAAAILFLVTGCGPSTPSRSASTPRQPASTASGPSSTASTPAMSVAIVSVKPATVTAKQATVTLHLRVKGIFLDATHMGKANVGGHGHIQLYLDRIPSDAYVRKDLTQHWLGAVAATTIGLNLPPAVVGGAGKHRIIAALARNDDVLYRVPMADTTITVK
jgi:hypothetical protein